ncbi:MAG TPA: hypothetical protein PK718_02755 [Candidatus Methanofastidiosa archaeon]|nr:hypothetical protein [Candidatus Methanofastidiosa archaeon]
MRERDYDVKKKKLIENLAWAAFVLLIGIILLVPGDTPEGTWYLFIGLILVCMNIGKYILGVPISTLTLGGGLVLSIAGLTDYAGLDLSLGPIVLIIIALLIAIRTIHSYQGK